MATRQRRRKPRAAGKPKPKLLFEKSAGAVVFRRGAALEFLLIFSNYWEFPKGLVEPAESEMTAAVREAREETGLDLQLTPGFRQELNYFYRRGDALVKKQVVYFLAQAREEDVQLSSEHCQFKWASFEDALASLQYENSREILRKAQQWLTAKDR